MRGVTMVNQVRQSIDEIPISTDSLRRIAEVLKRTLNEELTKEQQSSDAPKPLFAGAWSMLANECGGWNTQAHLNPEVYAQMRGRFSDDICREVLLAAAGVKISRTCLSDA